MRRILNFPDMYTQLLMRQTKFEVTVALCLTSPIDMVAVVTGDTKGALRKQDENFKEPT